MVGEDDATGRDDMTGVGSEVALVHLTLLKTAIATPARSEMQFRTLPQRSPGSR
jgi:hypothetical protein